MQIDRQSKSSQHSLNPQPIPPGKTHGLNPQPIPPGKALNPQPIPPGKQIYLENKGNDSPREKKRKTKFKKHDI
jgi:hypothetical protein